MHICLPKAESGQFRTVPSKEAHLGSSSDWRVYLQAEQKYKIAKLRDKGPDCSPNLQVR